MKKLSCITEHCPYSPTSTLVQQAVAIRWSTQQKGRKVSLQGPFHTWEMGSSGHGRTKPSVASPAETSTAGPLEISNLLPGGVSA